MGTILVLGQRLARPAHAWTTLFAACCHCSPYNEPRASANLYQAWSAK